MDQLLDAWKKFLVIWNNIPSLFKPLLLFTLWGAFVIVYYFLIYIGQQTEYTQHAHRFNRMRQKRKQLELFSQNKGKYKTQVLVLKRKIRLARQSLPRKKELSTLFRNIDETAKTAGLQIESFRPLGEKKKKLFAKVPFSLVVKGSFFELMVFFDKLSQFKHLVSVSKLSMTSGKEKSQKVILNGKFLLTTYRLITERERSKKKK